MWHRQGHITCRSAFLLRAQCGGAASQDESSQKSVIVLIGWKARSKFFREYGLLWKLGWIDAAYLARCEQEKRILHMLYRNVPVSTASIVMRKDSTPKRTYGWRVIQGLSPLSEAGGSLRDWEQTYLGESLLWLYDVRTWWRKGSWSTKTLLRAVFIILFAINTPTSLFALGEYDGVWVGQETISAAGQQETVTTGTIIYQESDNTFTVFDELFGNVALHKSGNQWILLTPIETTYLSV